MAKSALAGEMRTRITIKKLTPGIDAEGVATEQWTLLFGGMVRCKWVNAHGNEVLEGLRLEIGELATITMRYTPLITLRCRVWHENDAQTAQNAWEVISINNTESKNRFLDIKLKRVMVA